VLLKQDDKLKAYSHYECFSLLKFKILDQKKGENRIIGANLGQGLSP